MMMQGIDVAQYQGTIDWDKVKKSGKEFVFVRMGLSNYEGGIWKYDPMCLKNVKGALLAGLKVGIYVYGHDKTPDAARRTALEVVSNLKGFDISFPVAFDLEETRHSCLTKQGKQGLTDTFFAFAEAIKENGYTPILYTYTSFALQFLDMERIESKYDVWIADYREQTGINCPYKGKATIWQYRGETGVCDGVAVPCDLNVCYKDYSRKENTEVEYKSLYEKEKATRLRLVAGIERLIKEYK